MDSQKEKGITLLSIFISIILLGAIVYAFIEKSRINDGDILKLGQDTSNIESKNIDQDGNLKNMETQVENDRVSKVGDVLYMNYTGRLENGTVFDSNVDPKFGHVQPFSFTLGAGMVIAGWDEGLVGMKIGERKTLTIAPEKAYGDRSPSPLIPPNSTLIFDVELLDIK